MAYSQYSEDANTGADESLKNRISNNSNVAGSEDIQFPNKFDLFVNKENTSIEGFTVVEEHTLSQISGSVLYLDHRPAIDASGFPVTVTPSDGVIDQSQTNPFVQTVTFSTLPTSDPFTVTYNAVADKIQDSHVNALQNAVMRIQRVMGLTSATSSESGLITLPIATTFDPASAAELSQIQTSVPNVVLLGNLNTDLKIGSTNHAYLPQNNVTITLGNTGSFTRDNVVIDADSVKVQAQVGSTSGDYVYSSNVNDNVHISGLTEIASQTTIGLPGGAGATINTSVPTGAQPFYDNAALRVHGGIWFGSGMSGNGSITFVTTTGEAVDIQGNLIADTLQVDSTANFDGPATFNNTLDVQSPGNVTTNSDITLVDKSDGSPAKIDSLDPSYAKAVIEHVAPVKGCITRTVRQSKFTENRNPYVSGAKLHPVHGTWMYPMLGGWTYTGTVNAEKAASGQHPNVVLLDSDIQAIGVGYSTQDSLGGGSQSYGHYASGLFDPGDTYIEFDIPIGSSSNVAYPIYYHQPFVTTGTLTGVNVYLAADANALEQDTIAGATYRIFQPANAPVGHITTSFANPAAPVAILGNRYDTDYPVNDFSAVTYDAVDGGSYLEHRALMHKRLAAGDFATVDISNALTRSVDDTATPPAGRTGIAYIFASSRGTDYTRDGEILLRASPTPFGMLSDDIFTNGFNIRPGAEVPVGEVVATSNGSGGWTLVEAVSYRPDAFYDSCWVPIVEYRSAVSSITTIPGELGRCLPFYGALAGTEFTSGFEDYIFFVEHNIGPIRSMSDIELKVYIAAYGTIDTSKPFSKTSAGQNRLWSPEYEPYSSSHDFYNGASNANKGFVKDITEIAVLKMIDSRFAMIALNPEETSEGDFKGPDGSKLAQYIRVTIKRTR